MIRSCIKNYKNIIPIIDPNDYEIIMDNWYNINQQLLSYMEWKAKHDVETLRTWLRIVANTITCSIADENIILDIWWGNSCWSWFVCSLCNSNVEVTLDGSFRDME